MKCRIVAAVLAIFALCPSAGAQDPPAGILTEIGIDQKLNQDIPLHLEFQDESGRVVTLGDYFHGKPVILSLVYFECPMLCSMALNGLVGSLKTLQFTVGDEFEVLTVSIDPRETPSLAQAKKASYLAEYGRDGAAAGWHFLTGSEASIRELADATGFRYKWDPYSEQWAHVSTLILLTADGRVSQYLYGIEYAPRDVRLSLVTASENKIGSLLDRALLYCYHYDPATGKYGFVIMSALRIAGLSTVAALAGFIFIGLRRERRAAACEGKHV